MSTCGDAVIHALTTTGITSRNSSADSVCGDSKDRADDGRSRQIELWRRLICNAHELTDVCRTRDLTHAAGLEVTERLDELVLRAPRAGDSWWLQLAARRNSTTASIIGTSDHGRSDDPTRRDPRSAGLPARNSATGVHRADPRMGAASDEREHEQTRDDPFSIHDFLRLLLLSASAAPSRSWGPDCHLWRPCCDPAAPRATE